MFCMDYNAGQFAVLVYHEPWVFTDSEHGGRSWVGAQ